MDTEGLDQGKTDQIIQLMEAENLDILALQETKRPHNDTFTKDGYVFVFSSSFDTPPKKCENPLIRQFLWKANKNKKTIKGHGKGKQKRENKETEHYGVGLCYKEKLEKARLFYKQVGSKEMHLAFQTHHSPLRFVNSIEYCNMYYDVQIHVYTWIFRV